MTPTTENVCDKTGRRFDRFVEVQVIWDSIPQEGTVRLIRDCFGDLSYLFPGKH